VGYTGRADADEEASAGGGETERLLSDMELRVTVFERGSINASVPSNSLLTQMPSDVRASARGPSPTRIVEATIPRPGSIRETVPSRLFATQSEPSPTARATGPFPTGMVSTTVCRFGSTRRTTPRSSSATQRVDRERVRLATGPVQREHELPPEPLPQRMVGDQRLELRHELAVMAVREIGRDAVFQ
jgi:hypothetical protein